MRSARPPLHRIADLAWAALGTAAIVAGVILSVRVGADLLSHSASTPTPDWPVEGSFAVYHVHGIGGSPMGDTYHEYEGNITLTFASGAWSARCAAIEHDHVDLGMHPDRYNSIATNATFAPPVWQTDPRIGENVTGEVLGECDSESFTTQVSEESTFTMGDGAAPSLAAWHGLLEPCPCQSYDAQWSKSSGLLLSWSFAGLGDGFGGELTASDEPGITSK